MASLHDLVLIGDFNLHIDCSPSDVRQLTGRVLESFDLHQYAILPTHIQSFSWFYDISKGCSILSDQHLIWFETTFLLFLICEFQQTIVALCHSLSCTDQHWSLHGQYHVLINIEVFMANIMYWSTLKSSWPISCTDQHLRLHGQYHKLWTD